MARRTARASSRPCSSGVTPEMRIYDEESFGPVVGDRARSTASTRPCEVANDTDYGLAAAVFGADVPSALDVARRIECGICHVNGATVHDEPQMPFGGVKAQRLGALRRHARRSTSSPSCAGSRSRQAAAVPDLSGAGTGRLDGSVDGRWR